MARFLATGNPVLKQAPASRVQAEWVRYWLTHKDPPIPPFCEIETITVSAPATGRMVRIQFKTLDQAVYFKLWYI